MALGLCCCVAAGPREQEMGSALLHGQYRSSVSHTYPFCSLKWPSWPLHAFEFETPKGPE